MNTKELVIYQTQEGDISMDVLVENDTVWLTQKQMGLLFETSRNNITMHIANVFKEGELEEEVVCKESLHTTQHGSIKGKTQESSVKIYNLDVIISVGYRVKSKRGTQFRIWANKVLKNYIINGFAVNQKMPLEQYNDLKQTIKLLSNVVRNKEIALTANY
jgi:hypothetical protein